MLRRVLPSEACGGATGFSPWGSTREFFSGAIVRHRSVGGKTVKVVKGFEVRHRERQGIVLPVWQIKRVNPRG